MAKKRTKADKLQRNVERLEQGDDARREARGREDGHDLDDWLQAEAEIIGVRSKVAAA